MNSRLPKFDYKRPFFYMVTIKAAERPRLPFSSVDGGAVVDNEVTTAFKAVIERFHVTWYCIEPIRYFVIMPDHLHLIVKIRDIEKRVSLAVLVRQLLKALELSYRDCLDGASAAKPVLPTGASASGEYVFAYEWHDWIVKKEGQLEAFKRYILENPRRYWQRRQNKEYFTSVRRVKFAGRDWYAYGNFAILELPVIEPFKCSRKWRIDSLEWRKAVARASRLGPGGVGVGTFMSPCEKDCGNAIFKAGGSLIVLSPEGFGERWHPTRNKEALCAKGRMLFLSLYEPGTARPDNATLYRRCHEMGDIVAVAISGTRCFL